MTTAALAKAIGRTGYYTLDNGLRVPVVVMDVKSAYGNVRYAIAVPEDTSVAVWVDSGKVVLTGEVR